jgi:alpha-glucosidase
MGAYTEPGRLHMCYSFEMMGYDYGPAFFRSRIEDFFAGAPRGWPMWAFSNHDVVRHASRWAKHGASQDALARQAGAVLVALEGSLCLWQGEELGQTDTVLGFDELVDPQGIAFWPAPVGRDPTRTPMVWDGTGNGGFSTARPWLPVKPPQLARNVAAQEAAADSVLHTYRALLRYRAGSGPLHGGRSFFLDLPPPLLGFHRETGDERVTCLFNLSPGEQLVEVGQRLRLEGPSAAARLDRARLRLGPNGFAFLAGGGDRPAVAAAALEAEPA